MSMERLVSCTDIADAFVLQVDERRSVKRLRAVGNPRRILHSVSRREGGL
jgi:hypothetical protein